MEDNQTEEGESDDPGIGDSHENSLFGEVGDGEKDSSPEEEC